MIEAQLPANEATRIIALQRTQLLDTPIEERFERVTRLLCRLLSVPVASVSLVDETRQWFKSIQGSPMSETPRKSSFCAHGILSDDIMIIPDAHKDIRFANNPLVTGPEQVVFYAGHPLRAPDGSRVGMLCAIDHKPREFTEDDLQVLRDLASIAEAELNATSPIDTQKELLSQLDVERRRAMIDPLTRVWSRKGIMEVLTREHARAMRNHEHLGVLMADIDYFQRVNDAHGYPVGDAVLKEVAKRLLSSFRGLDAVGRIGGEEFLVVMPITTGVANIGAIASRACRHVAETGVMTNAGVLSLTISIGGVDETIDFSSDVAGLIKKADEALYRAKNMGRNRTEIVESRIA